MAVSLMMFGAAGCGGPLMGTLDEGVAGPFATSSRYEEPLTVLGTSDYAPDKYSDFYIQAVVNSVLARDVVTATLNRAGAIKRSFTAPRDGDVGMSFHFVRPDLTWVYGPATVTVTHQARKVGSVSFNIKN